MTDLRKAAEMALDALKDGNALFNLEDSSESYKLAIQALQSALAQPEQEKTMDGRTAKECEAMRRQTTLGYKQPEQEKLCIVCGKPTMHMGNKCYGCCQTAQPEQEPVAWVKDGVLGRCYLPKGFTGYLYAAPQSKPEQEPVAWMYPSDLKTFETNETTATAFSIEVGCPEEVSVPLYTAPLKREWVGLTDEERVKCYETTGHYQTLRPQDSFAVLSLARAIEAKLKEKNNG